MKIKIICVFAVMFFILNGVGLECETSQFEIAGRWIVYTQVKSYVADFTHDGYIFVYRETCGDNSGFFRAGEYEILKSKAGKVVLRFTINQDIFFVDLAKGPYQIGAVIFKITQYLGEEKLKRESNVSQIFTMERID